MNGNGQKSCLPSLTVLGAVFTTVFLLLLCAVGAYFPLLSLPTAAVSGALLAGLLLLHRTPLSVIAPLLAATAGALLAKSSTGAILSFLFLPIGFSIAFSVHMRMNRMSAIAVTGCASAFVGAVCLGASVLASGLAPGAFFHSLKESLSDRLTSYTVMTETGVRMPILTEESADILLSLLTVLLPAIVICTLFLLAYAATGLLWKILSRLGAADDFLPEGFRMVPGKLTAAVYLISQPLTLLLLTFPDMRGLYYGVYNVSLVFLLPLAVFGISEFLHQFRHNKSLSGTSRAALIVLVIMLIVSGIYWLLTFAAYYGIYIVFRTSQAHTSVR